MKGDTQIMAPLITYARELIEKPDPAFPVQVFHCRERQSLHEVHFFQPTLMLVLRGTKQISLKQDLSCGEGNLILVSAGHQFPFANVPEEFYMALAVGFSADDFDVREAYKQEHDRISVLPAPDQILTSINQLMALVNLDMGTEVLESRRKELAKILSALELDSVLRMPAQRSWQSRVSGLLQTDISRDWSLKEVCTALNTSESNLRRRLLAEGCGYRELLEDLRLTNGLGMIQTTRLPINQIALECGYQSSSRFSERFKKRFHTSPSELRKAH